MSKGERAERVARLLGLIGLLLLGVPRFAVAAAPLVRLAQPGPWSGISGLIGYGARLWFVNSVKFVDHNSADLYSYDPGTGTTRYERHLFSQDAGDPVVAGGLLYWPFEDPRFSTGHGEYVVTNGREWQWRVLPDGEVFHVHAMATTGDSLFAATSAWRAGLQRSDDGGRTWRLVYDRPTSPGTVSRLTTLAAVGSTLYAGLTSFGDDGASLLRLDGNTARPVPGWPAGGEVTTLRTFRGWLYGVEQNRHGAGVWRTDGTAVQRVRALDGQHVRAFAAAQNTLWAVSAHRGSGTLWRSADGVRWSVAQQFDRAEPLNVSVYAGRVYVGTQGPGERGALWGPAAPAPAEPPLGPKPLPLQAEHMPQEEAQAALARLGLVLRDPASYASSGAGVRAAVAPLALGRAEVGSKLSRALDGPFPVIDASLFGGTLTLPAAKLARWYLLWAIALTGHGRVPPALLTTPWRTPPNRAEKYLEAPPAAAWAVGELGQRDSETLAALIARLEVSDPPWVTGDFVGALTAVTGKRFGYDLTAWRRWWSAQRALR